MKTGLEIWVSGYCCQYSFTNFVCEQNALKKESYKNVQAYTLAHFHCTANKGVARLQENQKVRDQRGKMKQPHGSEEENTSKISMATIRNMWMMQKRRPLGIAWQFMAYYSDIGSVYGEIMQCQKQDSTQLKKSQVLWDIWYKNEERNEPLDREPKKILWWGQQQHVVLMSECLFIQKSEGDALE